MKPTKISLALLSGVISLSAQAQSSNATSNGPLSMKVGSANFTLYGNVDYYLSYQESDSGRSFTTLEEGAFLRTRLGVRGDKELANGLTAKFTLEQGVKGLSGEQAQADRLFDRQAWVGLAGDFGEVRIGRQNTLIFAPTALYQDFTYRSLGSLANSFSFPARLDDDIAYISPRINGLKGEVHYSFADDDGVAATSGAGNATDDNEDLGIYQYGLDYENGPFRVGFAGLNADTPPSYKNQRDAYFYNAYANYDYGKGKIYVAHTQSNNRSAGGPNFPLFPLGGQNDVATRLKDYGITTLSADYNVTDRLRIGALYSTITDDTAGTDEADGYAVGAYWKAVKDTTVYLILAGIDNENGGSYQFDGSAPLRKRFAAADVTGQGLTSVNVGFVYNF